MQWNDHSRLVGQHAFLGASKYHWLNYDTQRLVDAFMSCQAKEKGTRLHRRIRMLVYADFYICMRLP